MAIKPFSQKVVSRRPKKLSLLNFLDIAVYCVYLIVGRHCTLGLICFFSSYLLSSIEGVENI